MPVSLMKSSLKIEMLSGILCTSIPMRVAVAEFVFR